jgi:hypothetical protein
MRKLLTILASCALFAAPVALHADTLLIGQLSIHGSLTNTGTALDFVSGVTGTGTQTGSFATLVTDGQGVFTNNPILTYSPSYAPGSEVFTIGSLTISLESFMPTSAGMFDGTAILSAAGFLDTNATFSFTAPLGKGPVDFLTTISAVPAPAVPEPSTVALLGTGILSLAITARRKLFHA